VRAAGVGRLADRTLKIRDARIEDAVLDDRIIGVPRHEVHLHRGPQRRQACRELSPAHAGKDDVRQQQVDLRAVSARNVRRRFFAMFAPSVYARC